MRDTRHPTPAPRPCRSAWATAALALLVVLAQTLVLQHQSDHLGAGPDTLCTVCLSGSGLDHTVVTPALLPLAVGSPIIPARAAMISRRAALAPRTNARGPPAHLPA